VFARQLSDGAELARDTSVPANATGETLTGAAGLSPLIGRATTQGDTRRDCRSGILSFS